MGVVDVGLERHAEQPDRTHPAWSMLWTDDASRRSTEQRKRSGSGAVDSIDASGTKISLRVDSARVRAREGGL
jgi:hypothetical protein